MPLSVPAGSFAARGSQKIPANFANQIPSIAFSVPDLEGQATIELKAADSGEDLACIQSGVTNGKSVQVSAVSYIAAGIAGAALALTGLSALGGGAGSLGGHSPSPSFSTVFLWFQGVAMNGMMSVKYPPIYVSFTKNFAFSGGLIPWNSMQNSIDSFRKNTGGNLTADSVQYLQNATLVFTDGSSKNSSSMIRRSLKYILGVPLLETRDISTSVNGTESGNTSGGNTTNPTANKVTDYVHGIQGYVEQLTIPQANTFMLVLPFRYALMKLILNRTVLLIFSIVIGAITGANQAHYFSVYLTNMSTSWYPTLQSNT